MEHQHEATKKSITQHTVGLFKWDHKVSSHSLSVAKNEAKYCNLIKQN